MMNYAMIYYARKFLCCFATVNAIKFVHFLAWNEMKKKIDWLID